jgi:predicted lipid-binding transport protein (Tim44 family)
VTGRRLQRALGVALLAVLFIAPGAFAAAGGGSSGYGGSGGGGGGGSGEGIFWIIWFFIHLGPGGWLALGVIVAVIAIFLLVASMKASYAVNKKRRERSERIALAAVEAAEDDPVFSVENVRTAAAQLFLDVQAAWDARDRARLDELIGGDLLVEWQRRLRDFDKRNWHNRVKPQSNPAIEYMGLVNRAGDQDDRVVVRISARMDDYIETPGGGTILKKGETSTTVSVNEWWTLARHDGRWIVVSIESDAEGAHHFDAEIVATPEGDDRTLSDASLIEVAQDDAALPGVKTSEIADLDFAGDARAAAMDLSLADARFAPDVLEVAVRRAVAGWAEAIDGGDDPLLEVASPEVAKRLLYPEGGNTRVVVRGPNVRHMRITDLDAAQEPARMSVEVEVKGRRYVEDRDTAAVVAGSKDSESSFTERWTLAIDGPPENPWRIVSAG